MGWFCHPFCSSFKNNEAKFIYTGAPVPGSNKIVVPKENYIYDEKNNSIIIKKIDQRHFIRFKGEDFKKNKIIYNPILAGKFNNSSDDLLNFYNNNKCNRSISSLNNIYNNNNNNNNNDYLNDVLKQNNVPGSAKKRKAVNKKKVKKN